MPEPTKRQLVLLLLPLLLLAALSGCAKSKSNLMEGQYRRNLPDLDVVEQQDAPVEGAEQVVYKNIELGFQLTLPAEWRDNCDVNFGKNPQASWVDFAFLPKDSLQGTLYPLMKIIKAPQKYKTELLQEETGLAKMILAQTGDDVYILRYPLHNSYADNQQNPQTDAGRVLVKMLTFFENPAAHFSLLN